MVGWIKPTATAILMAVLLTSIGCGAEQRTDSTEKAKEPRPTTEERPSRERETDGAEPLLEPGDRVVVAGDSLGVTGSDRPYPERLRSELGAEIEVTNLSEPGTTTRDWLPGNPLFDEGLEPALDGADLLLLTLGGNDLEAALGATSGPAGLEAALSPAAAEVLASEFDGISDRLARLISAARGLQSGLAVVYVSYPDYSSADAFTTGRDQIDILAFQAVLAGLIGGADRADPDAVVNLMTATAATGDVDRLLVDREYLGDRGHSLYAEEIVRAISRR